MQPSVCAICLTADRPEMTRRAVRAFEAQNYERKTLLIYDSGRKRFDSDGIACTHVVFDIKSPMMLGLLRNAANQWAKTDILLHWDSDDWSAANRITDQVALLQSGDYEAVGYSSMLFWDSVKQEAWMYRHISRPDTYCLGTSLCYWRKTWERKPFPNKNAGEDHDWHRELNTRSIAAFSDGCAPPLRDATREPLMVAEIHGRNTAARIMPGKAEWERVSEWDEKLKAIMTI